MTSQPLSEPGNNMKPRRSWMRVLLWTMGGVGFLLLLLVASVAALLHSARFHQYLLQKADQIASEQLGTRVTLQNFVIHFSSLSVELYGLTIDGAPPYSAPPLLQVQHAVTRLSYRVRLAPEMVFRQHPRRQSCSKNLDGCPWHLQPANFERYRRHPHQHL